MHLFQLVFVVVVGFCRREFDRPGIYLQPSEICQLEVVSTLRKKIRLGVGADIILEADVLRMSRVLHKCIFGGESNKGCMHDY